MGSEKKKEKELSEFDELFVEYVRDEPAREIAQKRIEKLSDDIYNGLGKSSGTTKEFLSEKVQLIKKSRYIDWINMLSAIIKERCSEEDTQDVFDLIEEMAEELDFNQKKVKELKDQARLFIKEGTKLRLKRKMKSLRKLAKKEEVADEIARIEEIAKENRIKLEEANISKAELSLLRRAGCKSEVEKRFKEIVKLAEKEDISGKIQRMLEYLREARSNLAAIGTSSKKLARLRKKGYLSGAKQSLELGRKYAKKDSKHIANSHFEDVVRYLEKIGKDPEFIHTSEKELRSCEPGFWKRAFS